MIGRCLLNNINRHAFSPVPDRHRPFFADLESYRIQNGNRGGHRKELSDALRIASESSSIFHGLRLQLAEWFEQAARPKSMKFYDCERGAYVILTSGKNAADACDELCRSIEKQFEAPWRCEGREFHLSVQISEIRFVENPASVQDLLYMIAQPFVHQTEGISHANRRELLSSFRPGSAESGRLPP